MSKLLEVNEVPVRVLKCEDYHDITFYGHNGHVMFSYGKGDNKKKTIKETRKLIKVLEQAIEFLEEE